MFSLLMWQEVTNSAAKAAHYVLPQQKCTLFLAVNNIHNILILCVYLGKKLHKILNATLSCEDHEGSE